MTMLVHPDTGQEFDALPRSVPLYQRSGWAVKETPVAGGQPPAGGKSTSAAGNTAEVPKQES